jgi:hypothetical protein
LGDFSFAKASKNYRNVSENRAIKFVLGKLEKLSHMIALPKNIHLRAIYMGNFGLQFGIAFCFSWSL